MTANTNFGTRNIGLRIFHCFVKSRMNSWHSGSPYRRFSVILLMCKSRDGWKVCADFLQQYPGTSIQLESKLTDSVVEEGGGRKLHQMSEEIFSSISDWTTLLEYVDVELAEADLEFIQENAIMARLRDSLRDAGLVQDAMPEPHFMVLCVLYMSPRSTPAAKMVERLCMRVEDKHTDVLVRHQSHQSHRLGCLR